MDVDEINELNATFEPDLAIVLSTGRHELEWIPALATAFCIASLASLARGIVIDYSIGNQYLADDAVKWATAEVSKIHQ